MYPSDHAFHGFAARCSDAPRLAEGEFADKSFAQRHPLRILLAEGNYTNRQLLLALLRGLGYDDVVACENGTECLTLALVGDFDVLLDDVELTELSGIECADKLREAGQEIFIVAMLPSTPDFAPSDHLTGRVNDRLQKPVELGDLKRVLTMAGLYREAFMRAHSVSIA